MNINEVFKQTKTRGDLATVLIAGSIGFVIDSGLNIIDFLEPGSVGTIFATSALSVKIGIEEFFKNEKTNKILHKKSSNIIELLELKNDNSSLESIERIKQDLLLLEKEIISPSEFHITLQDIITKQLRK